MSFNKKQFLDLIERTLKEIGLFSPEAVSLLAGTAAQESLFGTYLTQLGITRGKGGISCFQVERVTFDWLKQKYSGKFPIVKEIQYEELEWNLKSAIIMARLKYYSCPGPIPKDLKGQAAYWNKFYNGNPDYGTDAEYLANYDKYVNKNYA